MLLDCLKFAVQT